MSEIHNRELYQHCEQLSLKTIEKLKPQLSTFYHQSSMEQIMFLSKHEKIISQFPEYLICLDIMKKDPTISKHLGTMVGTYQGKSRIEATDVIRGFLELVLEKYSEKGNLDTESFNLIYQKFESFFYSDKIPMSYKILISNFLYDKEIEIEKNLVIRPIKHNEKKFFTDRNTMGIFNPYDTLTHVIEHIVFVEKVIGDNESKKPVKEENEYDILEKVLNTLRLFKKGNIHTGIFVTESDSPMIGHSISWSDRGMKTHSHSELYALKSEEISELIKLWNVTINSRYHQSKAVSIAIRRLIMHLKEKKMKMKSLII